MQGHLFDSNRGAKALKGSAGDKILGRKLLREKKGKHGVDMEIINLRGTHRLPAGSGALASRVVNWKGEQGPGGNYIQLCARTALGSLQVPLCPCHLSNIMCTHCVYARPRPSFETYLALVRLLLRERARGTHSAAF
jgi:hypothetical protein